ncbi:E3 ubiquitin-protein ligase ATL31-like [Silene latifolia]|uniref:E3 ubiquitin-protein ligase ATL31-like n=1 Tax=Silene latifolia TaxID=37657 RepID=UPI003D77C201
MKSNKTTPIQILVLLVLLLTIVEAQKTSDDGSSDGGVSFDGGSNVKPSMAIVIIVLVLGFFITGCISIYIQHCVDTSSSTSVMATRAIANRNTNRGLDQSVIDTFPVFPYSAVKELKIGKGALECAVCLSEFEEDETLRFLPKCDHVFHAECIDTWLQGHTTCPVCRDNLVVVAASSTTDVNNQPGDLQSSTTPTSGSEVRITINDNNETTSLPKKLPRAHSTGHSLIQAGENCERYTLRLPAEVRRQLLARTKLKRATSMMTLPRQTSSRRGYRGGGGGDGSGSSRYGRLFGRSFLMRVASFRSTVKIGVDGDSTAAGKVPKSCSTDQSFPPPLPV